ncbi:MAG: hypothetical protein EA383_14700 [Spirochaetaceae bacterium]|nr:MAG: hypothetical protein EA383_14700 [Spirochaetaceae bacterium]
MKRSSEAALQLIAELESDFAFIRESEARNLAMVERLARTGSPDEFDFAAHGYTLHNLYNSFEAYFLRIAKFFENNLGDTGWHRDLLERMTLDIEGLRVQLFPRAFAHRLEELLKFRHRFRNIYKNTLDPRKMDAVQEAANHIADDFAVYHERYIAFLRALAEELRD